MKTTRRIDPSTDLQPPDVRRGPRLIFGLALVVIGTLAALDRLSLFDLLDLLAYFWPALLLFAGLWKLLVPGSPASRVTGAVLAGWGGLWLADELGWMWVDWGELWPLLLVAFGIILLVRSRSARPTRQGDEGGTVDAVAFLGGKRRTASTTDFRGGDLVAVMGGCEVDLRQAHLTGGSAVIDAFALWGGVEIAVPARWRVRMQGVPILGGFVDKTTPPELEDGVEGELVVKGFAIMGAVEVSN